MRPWGFEAMVLIFFQKNQKSGLSTLKNVSGLLQKIEIFCTFFVVTLVVALLTLASMACADDLAVSRFSVEGLAGWTPKKFAGTTDYRLVNENGRVAVKATSNAAASGLIKEMRFNPATYRYLRWSWKINHTIKGGDERSKAGDDYAARLYIVFPGRFFWQMKAINYIWANILPKGESIPNPYAAGVMMIAVESGPAEAGQWRTEERDIAADYRSLFGEEPEEATAIAIMTDTDNTGGSATAWYGEITLSTKP